MISVTNTDLTYMSFYIDEWLLHFNLYLRSKLRFLLSVLRVRSRVCSCARGNSRRVSLACYSVSVLTSSS